MSEDDEFELAIRDARNNGDQVRLQELELKRALREQDKERLKLDVLKQQVMQAQEKQDKTMTTQSRAEEEKDDILTAQEKPTAEQQIKDAKRREDAKEESEEYQQEPG